MEREEICGKSPETQPKQIRTLIVEDDSALRKFISTNLVVRGCLVTDVDTTRDALKVLELERKFGLVITDLQLPDDLLGGLKVAHQARERGAFVVLTTGSDRIFSQEELNEHGVSRFLPKPFRLAEIKDILGTVRQSPIQVTPSK